MGSLYFLTDSALVYGLRPTHTSLLGYCHIVLALFWTAVETTLRVRKGLIKVTDTSKEKQYQPNEKKQLSSMKIELNYFYEKRRTNRQMKEVN